MNILALDTSALTASVAIMKDEKVVFDENVTCRLTHSETLMPMVDSALKSVEMSLSDIDLFAAANGPGSFTGVRIGVSTVKALAYASDKNVCGVSTLLSLAYNLAAAENIPIVPIMDARRGQVYNAVYIFEGGKAREITPPRALSIEELCGEISSPVIFVGDGVDAYMDKIVSLLPEYANFAPPNLRLQKAASVACAANFDESVSPEELGVIYLRKSQAEREREEKIV